jgi:hypothetical protein
MAKNATTPSRESSSPGQSTPAPSALQKQPTQQQLALDQQCAAKEGFIHKLDPR